MLWEGQASDAEGDSDDHDGSGEEEADVNDEDGEEEILSEREDDEPAEADASKTRKDEEEEARSERKNDEPVEAGVPEVREETDETFEAFKRALGVKNASDGWAAKFARDAEAEKGVLSVLDRMDRDGARYRHAEQQMNDRGLTEKEERDLDAAKRGAYARRDRMLLGMTKAEQRAFKTRRR